LAGWMHDGGCDHSSHSFVQAFIWASSGPCSSTPDAPSGFLGHSRHPRHPGSVFEAVQSGFSRCIACNSRNGLPPSVPAPPRYGQQAVCFEQPTAVARSQYPSGSGGGSLRIAGQFRFHGIMPASALRAWARRSGPKTDRLLSGIATTKRSLTPRRLSCARRPL